jgi:uncharacterized protein (TIGR03437 family)
MSFCRQKVVLMPAVALACFLTTGSLLPAATNYCDWKAKAYFEPRVLRKGQTGNVRFTFWFDPVPTRVELSLLEGGPSIPVPVSANGSWTIEVPAEKALKGYQEGLGHNFFGYMDEYDGTVLAVRSNLIVNVWDETMPLVQVNRLAHPTFQAQMSRHVLNLREDTAHFFQSTGVPVDVLKRFYLFRPDDFDFLGVVGEGVAFANRYYQGVRNDTQGLGSAPTNTGAAYGSANRLQGIVQFPNDNFFDLAEPALSHELGHRWCCFLKLPALTPGSPHWPMGDVAYGIMGITVGGEGAQFPYRLLVQGDGTYRTQYLGVPDEFNDLELYLMGLLPPSQVAEHFVFQDQTQNPMTGTLRGPVNRFNINDVIASAGQRVPATGSAQTAFRFATMVLSRNRLLEPFEMAFFEYMAARGEAMTQLPAAVGVMVTTVKPFHLSTRGKATLSTTVCPDCPGGLVNVSSASFRRGSLAPDSIASAFGFGLAATTQVAGSSLPTSLGEVSVIVNDRGGAGPDLLSRLTFVSPGQVNYLVGTAAVAGPALVKVVFRGRVVASGQVVIEPVVPALYTANGNGLGVPAARTIRITSGNVVTYGLAFQCGASGCTPLPLSLGPESDQLFLELYATGIRGRSDLSAVHAYIDGIESDVLYAGSNPNFAGLDQVNVRVPRSLAGRGVVKLVLLVDGKTSNEVTVQIR